MQLSPAYKSDALEILSPMMVVGRKTKLSKNNSPQGGMTYKKDATKNQAEKMSPSLKRLVSTLEWRDVFRLLHPRDLLRVDPGVKR